MTTQLRSDTLQLYQDRLAWAKMELAFAKMAKADWDESKHPRGEHGRFGSGGGGGAGADKPPSGWKSKVKSMLQLAARAATHPVTMHIARSLLLAAASAAILDQTLGRSQRASGAERRASVAASLTTSAEQRLSELLATQSRSLNLSPRERASLNNAIGSLQPEVEKPVRPMAAAQHPGSAYYSNAGPMPSGDIAGRSTPPPEFHTTRNAGSRISESGTSASVPFMITRDMKQQLLDQGHSRAAINAMTPSEAHQHLSARALKVRVLKAAARRGDGRQWRKCIRPERAM